MNADSRAIRVIELGLLLFGSLLVLVFALAHVHRFIMFRAEMRAFDGKQFESSRERHQRGEATNNTTYVESMSQVQKADYSLWSAQRTRLHRATLDKSAEPLAVLRIPKLRLEVPVLEGTDEFTLNRGVGIIAGTSRPGEGGNIGIAGHRDGFFRPLKDISAGDTIELITASGTDVYAVEQVSITKPSNVSVLRSRARPSLTLVTCYPFYLAGPAPKRYIVEAFSKQWIIPDQM